MNLFAPTSSSGGNERRCYKQDEFVARIEGALRVKMDNVSCKIVDRTAMSKVMGRAGWGKNQTTGVVGFHLGKDVYVLEGSPWTVLHELVHRAGVNADRLNRYVAEGLTEAIAMQLKRSPDEHRPTYHAEQTWVTDVLLPAVDMTAVDLGGRLARAKNAPACLAKLVKQKNPGVNAKRLRRQLAPQKPDRPDIGTGSGNVTYSPVLPNAVAAIVAQPQGWDEPGSGVGLGTVLLLAGAALILPSVVGRGR